MTAWYDGIDVTVEVAFDTAPLDPSPVWEDISGFVYGLETQRGKADEFSQFSPGRMSLELDNDVRTFDPLHTAGPYHGKLVPMKRVRVVASRSPWSVPIFDGFVLAWPSTLSGSTPLQSTALVQCVDATHWLENLSLERSAYEAAVLADGPSHYWPLQEQNTTASATYGDVVAGRDVRISTVLGGGVVMGSPEIGALDAGLPLAVSSYPMLRTYDVGGGFWSSDELRSAVDVGAAAVHGVEFWVSATAWAEGSLARVAVDSNTSPDRTTMSLSIDGGYLWVQFRDPVVGVVNPFASTAPLPLPVGVSHVACWFDGADLVVYVDGVEWWRTATISGSTPNFGALSPLAIISTGAGLDRPERGVVAVSHVAVYGAGPEPDWQQHYMAGLTAWGHPHGERSGERIDRVLDEVGWPAVWRDLPPGDTVQGIHVPNRMSAMEYLRAVGTAEDGLVFIDAAGRVTLVDRQRQWLRPPTISLTDDGTGVPVDGLTIVGNSLDSIRNRSSVTYRPSYSGYVAVTDTPSQDAYGPLNEALSVPTIDDPVTARKLVTYRVETLKDPRTRITSAVVDVRNVPAGLQGDVLGVELGDRVAITVTPTGTGDPVDLDVVVIGIDDVVSGASWVRTFAFGPARELAVEAPYLIVGDPVFGKTGATAGNKIPF